MLQWITNPSVSMTSFASVITVQWSNTIPSWNVQLLCRIHLTLFLLQQFGPSLFNILEFAVTSQGWLFGPINREKGHLVPLSLTPSYFWLWLKGCHFNQASVDHSYGFWAGWLCLHSQRGMWLRLCACFLMLDIWAYLLEKGHLVPLSLTPSYIQSLPEVGHWGMLSDVWLPGHNHTCTLSLPTWSFH